MTSSTSHDNGILEQLEAYFDFKLNCIRGLLELRSSQPNEKYLQIFQNVFRYFSELDLMIDTLISTVEQEKSFVKYLESILKCHQLQMYNLKKMSEKMNERQKLSEDSGKSKEPESTDNEKNKLTKFISKKPLHNKIHLSRSFKTTKTPSQKNFNGIPPRSGILGRPSN